jgi:hypothetical protein
MRCIHINLVWKSDGKKILILLRFTCVRRIILKEMLILLLVCGLDVSDSQCFKISGFIRGEN